MSYKFKVDRCTSGCDTSVSVFTRHNFDYSSNSFSLLLMNWLTFVLCIFFHSVPSHYVTIYPKICDINNRLFLSAHPLSLVFVSHASRSFISNCVRDWDTCLLTWEAAACITLFSLIICILVVIKKLCCWHDEKHFVLAFQLPQPTESWNWYYWLMLLSDVIDIINCLKLWNIY